MTTLPQYTPYYGGGQVPNPANVLPTVGAPSTVLTEDRLGTMKVDNAAGNIYGLASKSGGIDTWVLLGGSSGAIASVVGTANQITANTAANVVTLSLPVAIIAPGSLTTTTTLAATTTITAGTGIIATTGNIAASSGNVTASGTVTGGTGVIATTGNVVATAGAVNAGTSMTATLGAITLTNGNLVFGTAGNKILSTSVGSTTTAGANSFGSVTLVSGSATVSTTAVTASSLIVLWRQSIGSTGANPVGLLTVGTISAGTSFVINAATTASASTPVATDVSVVGWMIIN